MPCFLHLAWGSCELLLGGTEEVSTCRAAQKCHRENLKTCDKCHYACSKLSLSFIHQFAQHNLWAKMVAHIASA